MESKKSKKPVFLMREPGMPFAEFKKYCIQAFKEAGLLENSNESSTNLPSDSQLRLHKMYEQGLDEDLLKANQGKPLQPMVGNKKKPTRKN